MIVNMEFQGMEQLLKNLQEARSIDVVGQCTRHIINLSKLETHRAMKRNVPRSRNHSTTGRYLGHRFVQYSPAHAADVIPVSNTRTDTDGRSNAEVGWKLSDNSPQFYMKFVEWGTSKMRPREFINQTNKQCEGMYRRIAETTLQSYANKYLGD